MGRRGIDKGAGTQGSAASAVPIESRQRSHPRPLSRLGMLTSGYPPSPRRKLTWPTHRLNPQQQQPQVFIQRWRILSHIIGRLVGTLLCAEETLRWGQKCEYCEARRQIAGVSSPHLGGVTTSERGCPPRSILRCSTTRKETPSGRTTLGAPPRKGYATPWAELQEGDSTPLAKISDNPSKRGENLPKRRKGNLSSSDSDDESGTPSDIYVLQTKTPPSIYQRLRAKSQTETRQRIEFRSVGWITRWMSGQGATLMTGGWIQGVI